MGPDGMPLGRPNTNPPPLSHPGPHPSQQNLLHGMGRTNMVVMSHGGGDGNCTQTISDAGETSALSTPALLSNFMICRKKYEKLKNAVTQSGADAVVNFLLKEQKIVY